MRKNKQKTLNTRRPPSLRVMAHDPGTVNYGWSVISAKGSYGGRVSIEVIANGMCPVTVKELKSGPALRRRLWQHNRWANKVARTHNVQFVVAERYMARGGKGPTIEAVNMMLGSLLRDKKPCKVIPASQWKNAMRRADVDLDEWYKWTKVTPHQLDACLIGIYICSTLYGHKGLDGISIQKNMKKIVLQIEKTSQQKLIDRKIRRT